jgi:uncharacterized MAPEG superfamily protein
MTTPFWCLLAAVLLPILIAFSGSFYRAKQFGSADNNNPRAQAQKLEGAGARAYAAQANAWEALAMFTVAVLVSHLAGVPESEAAPWAIAFVIARVLHPIFYIRDLAPLRSASFLVGMVCIIALFVKAA